MVAFDIRRTARENLKGKWGKAALITFCYVIVQFLMGFISGLFSGIPILALLINIAYYVISIPLGYGFLVSFIKLKRGEAVECFDFITIATSSVKRAWGVVGNIILKLLPIFIALVIFTILNIFAFSYYIYTYLSVSSFAIDSNTSLVFGLFMLICPFIFLAVAILFFTKSLYYSLSYFILYDRPELSGKVIIEESARLMQRNRWKQVWLYLTFIGWIILSAFTLYIGLLWLMPYILISFVIFYEDLSNQSTPLVHNSDTNDNSETDSNDQGPIIIN